MFNMNVQSVKNQENFITLKVETEEEKKEKKKGNLREMRYNVGWRAGEIFRKPTTNILKNIREKYHFCDTRTQE